MLEDLSSVWKTFSKHTYSYTTEIKYLVTPPSMNPLRPYKTSQGTCQENQNFFHPISNTSSTRVIVNYAEPIPIPIPITGQRNSGKHLEKKRQSDQKRTYRLDKLTDSL